ncbi:ribose-phosphate pyrophosphokinase [Fusarium beomiforme]|uniref:Ribose-phosphate pyrophosphokinase n=1 Tax=Fusarium beomiforme TaxID=44412 RepID=A0A9P5DQB0_9HYPO|nr:ribose-phosphate pyrophosphokinase [Fusarium beomiforme]
MEEYDSIYDEELEEYVSEFEERLGRKLGLGRGTAKCLRMALDKDEILHLPDVACDFICRCPSQTNESLLSYFGSRDIGIAHTLFRRFFWANNLLWKEDLQNRPAAIVLVGRDSVLDTKSIRAYLLGAKDWARKTAEAAEEKSQDGNLKVIWFQDLDHGHVFDQNLTRLRFVEIVRAFCNEVDTACPKEVVNNIRKK